MKRILFVVLLGFKGVGSAWGGDPGFVEEYRDLRLMIGRQQFAEAMVVCRSLIERCPANIPLYETLVEVGLYGEQLDDVYRFLEDRIITGMNPEYAYFGTGLVRYNKRDYKTAVLHFDKAITLGLSAPECYRMLEYAYEKTSGEEAAIRFFTLLCHRDPDNANHWYGLALAYWDKRDAGKIFRYLDNALQRRPDEPVYLQARAAAMSLLGNETKALKLMIAALSRSFEQADYQGFFFVQAHLVQMQILLGKRDADQTAIQTLIDMATKFGFYRWQGWGYLKESDLHYLQADFLGSDLAMQKAYKSSLTSRDMDLTYAVLVRSVETSLALGRVFKALDFCLQRASLAEKEHNELHYFLALTDLARIYNDTGKYRLALEYASEALSRSEGFPKNTNSTIRLRCALGQAYRGLAKYSDAISNFRLALEDLPSNGVWTYLHSDILGEIGQCYLLMNRIVEAKKSFTMQYGLAQKIGATAVIAAALGNLGDCSLQSGKYNEARDFYQKGLRLSERLGYLEAARKGLRGIARVSEKIGDLQTASETLLELESKSIEHDQLSLQDIPFFAAGGQRRVDSEHLVDVLVQAKEFEKAFLLAEKDKLADFFDPFLLPVERFSISQMGEEGRALEKSILQTRSLIGQLSRNVAGPHGHNPYNEGLVNRGAFLVELASREIQYIKILDSLAAQSPSLRGILHPVPEPLANIQSRLAKSEQVLLEYCIGDYRTILFVVTSETLAAFQLPIGRERIAQLLTNYSPVLNPRHTAEPISNVILANFDERCSHDLYNVLVSPASMLLNGKKRIVIVADDCLRNLPFDILAGAAGAGNSLKGSTPSKYLVGQYEISYAITATESPLVCAEQNVKKPILIVGQDVGANDSGQRLEWTLSNDEQKVSHSIVSSLTGVHSEILRLIRILPSATSILNGDSTYKSRIVREAKGFQVIHIASHANYNDEYPLASSMDIMQSSDSTDGGVIFACELPNLELNADLVVLSGCNTARWSAGGRNYGFVRGLLTGGSSTVIGSLWQVDDESTAELMERFYTHLLTGVTTARALQLAKIDLIEAGFRDPYYWGGFILVGKTATIDLRETPARSPDVIYSMLGAATATILLLLLFERFLTKKLVRRMVQE
jgi:CHAT domain-containing protein/tetratricopeptide (TPR) repeat protein